MAPGLGYYDDVGFVATRMTTRFSSDCARKKKPGKLGKMGKREI